MSHAHEKHAEETAPAERWLGALVASVLLTSITAASFSTAWAQTSGCSPVSTANLDGYWKLDENTGTTAADATGNGHTGTLVNGPSWTDGTSVIAPNPSALSFDGTDDYVDVNGNAFSFPTGNFTVSLFTKTASDWGNRGVLGTYNGSRGWGLYLYANNTVNFLALGSAGSNDAAKAATVLDDRWHHLAGVYTRSGDNLTIDTYVDGVLKGSQTAAVGDIGTSGRLTIGKYTGANPYRGTLDDVRIYGRALSASEVDNLADGCGNASSSPSVSSVSSGSSVSSSSVSSASSASSVSSSSSSSLSSSSVSSRSSSSSVFAIPQCNGQTATVYVQGRTIKGGPMDGRRYGSVLMGTDGKDVIVGTDRPGIIFGKDGDDVICAGNGNNVVYGGKGNDVITGGNGRNIVNGDDGDDRITLGNGGNIVKGGAGSNTCVLGKGKNVVRDCAVQQPSASKDKKPKMFRFFGKGFPFGDWYRS
ncbi:MAG: hypothetical protein PHW10_03440 [Candidatus Peribacteraceae bacterium]|nr:hypothetical protein [Candidatus Peribacteraceae bacterium]